MFDVFLLDISKSVLLCVTFIHYLLGSYQCFDFFKFFFLCSEGNETPLGHHSPDLCFKDWFWQYDD